MRLDSSTPHHWLPNRYEILAGVVVGPKRCIFGTPMSSETCAGKK
jgi:hypothetical protein